MDCKSNRPRTVVKGTAVKTWLFASLTAVLAAPASAGEMKEYVWKEGQCAILLPGEPQVKKNSLQVIAGEGIYLVHYLDRELGKKGPLTEKDKAESAEEALGKTRDELVKSLGGKLLGESKVKLGEHPGRELLIDAKALGLYRVRLYLAGPRVYQVVLVGPRELVRSKAGDRYFESFRLVK